MNQNNENFNESINPDFKAKKSLMRSVDEYVEGIVSGNRTILSQAITLIESSREDHKELSREILENCLDRTGNSVRIGITGVPGVGKSTFIDALGIDRIVKGDKIAVLTIDPSSSLSKGSILGDKTRMEALSVHPDAFIRPSPASGTLGGVARKTREALLLCEAAGFNIILIETVGVGQSETAVHSMVDFFLVLMLTGAGDELQGIKRGIMEMADMIAINKADGANLDSAKRAVQQIQNALALFSDRPSGWKPPVVMCSAMEGSGIIELWEKIENYVHQSRKSGYFVQKRKVQSIDWMVETIEQQLKEMFYKHPDVKRHLMDFENKVNEGTISSFKAASELIKLFESKKS
ncbi:MAG: methylmalonyl Co-A mutase-associated GTPase MeaB [Balneolaceae bacterium]